MTMHYAVTLPTRLCACGPLLYLGLMGAIDPDGVAESLGSLAGELRAFEHRLKGVRWVEHYDVARVSAGVRNALRFAGIALTLCTFLLLSGVVD